MRIPVVPMFIATATAAALGACRASPRVAEGYGLLEFPSFCDTTVKHVLRPAEIPDVSIAAEYGSLTGIVFREGTGNGIDGASIFLSPQDSATAQSSRLRVTGPTGGFTFDSLPPGRYRLRVVAVWEHEGRSIVSIARNRVDTVRFPMRAPGVCTRS